MSSTDRKVALITGGGTGIGRATAELLAANGCICVLAYSRSAAETEAVAHGIEAAGGTALALKADVSDENGVQSMVATIREKFKRLDYLVNSAGRTSFIPLEDLEAVTDEDWNGILGVNVVGTFRVIRACATELRKSGGSVVNVSSIAGEMGRGSSIPYCVSKSGVDALTRVFARVLSPEVTVNAVAPGIVDTRWVAGKEDHVRLQSEGTLLKRICKPEDVAEVIVSLLTHAGFVTGQIVTIDGGFTL